MKFLPRKFIVATILVPILFTTTAFFYKNNVIYAKYSKETKQNTNAIYLDRLGKFYPPIELGEFEKRANAASLIQHFKKEKKAWQANLTLLNLNVNSSFEILQEKIIDNKATEINKYVAEKGLKSVTFILVGFNNYYDEEGKSPISSNVKLDNLIDKVNIYKPDNKTLFIKLYWDGKYASDMGGTAKNFSYATANSYYCGFGIRRLIKSLACSNINFVSHSLGANIICEAIFNQESKVTNRDNFLDSLKKLHNKKEIFVKDKNLRLAMVAPAIPGSTTFKDYFDVTLNPSIDNKKVKFLIGYNKNDEVLKKLVNLPKYLGSTTLGCLESEGETVENKFKQEGLTENFRRVDFSDNDPTIKGVNTHDLNTYLSNEKKYKQVIDFLFE